MPEATVVVAAAVVRRGESYLVTRRLRGTHLEGLWEFPGGKCEAGETQTACLRREILEELGCGAEVGEKLGSFFDLSAQKAVHLADAHQMIDG